MAADGTWNLTLQTPMGERRSVLTLATSGATLTGTQEAEGNTTDISEGSVNGNEVSWKVSITNPMPLTLTFNGTVDGNSLNGNADTGPNWVSGRNAIPSPGASLNRTPFLAPSVTRLAPRLKSLKLFASARAPRSKGIAFA